MEADTEEKTRNVLDRDYRSLGLCTEMANLAKAIDILVDGKVVYSSSAQKSSRLGDSIGDILFALIRWLDGEDTQLEKEEDWDDFFSGGSYSPEDPEDLELFIEEKLGGDNAHVVRILKACTQAAISPANRELRIVLTKQHLTKEIPASWHVSVDFQPEYIIVHSVKQEQCTKNHFRYEYQVEIIFDADTYECTSVGLKVIDLMFHKLCHDGREKGKKTVIKRLLSEHASDKVLEDSETRNWVYNPKKKKSRPGSTSMQPPPQVAERRNSRLVSSFMADVAAELNRTVDMTEDDDVDTPTKKQQVEHVPVRRSTTRDSDSDTDSDSSSSSSSSSDSDSDDERLRQQRQQQMRVAAEQKELARREEQERQEAELRRKEEEENQRHREEQRAKEEEIRRKEEEERVMREKIAKQKEQARLLREAELAEKARENQRMLELEQKRAEEQNRESVRLREEQRKEELRKKLEEDERLQAEETRRLKLVEEERVRKEAEESRRLEEERQKREEEARVAELERQRKMEDDRRAREEEENNKRIQAQLEIDQRKAEELKKKKHAPQNSSSAAIQPFSMSVKDRLARIEGAHTPSTPTPASPIKPSAFGNAAASSSSTSSSAVSSPVAARKTYAERRAEEEQRKREEAAAAAALVASSTPPKMTYAERRRLQEEQERKEEESRLAEQRAEAEALKNKLQTQKEDQLKKAQEAEQERLKNQSSSTPASPATRSWGFRGVAATPAGANNTGAFAPVGSNPSPRTASGDKPDYRRRTLTNSGEIVPNAITPQNSLNALAKLQEEKATLLRMQQEEVRKKELRDQKAAELPLISYPNGDSYQGELNEDKKRHGKGVYTTKNGDVYTGDYQNGQKHGRGIYVRSDGSRYEGEFQNGMFTGHGVYTFENGDIYNGNFDHDEFNGHGRWSSVNKDFYDGMFSNGKRCGQGVYTFANGSRYEGEWSQGAFHGFGLYTFPTGDSYEGEFSGGKFHGKGVYTFAQTGKRVESIFENGKPVKKE